MANIKIYKMNDCDWYAAETIEDAEQALAEMFGCETIEEYKADYPGEEIVEVSENEMQTLIFNEDDDDPASEYGVIEKTFRQKLDEMIAGGEEFPTFFASTEY